MLAMFGLGPEPYQACEFKKGIWWFAAILFVDDIAAV